MAARGDDLTIFECLKHLFPAPTRQKGAYARFAWPSGLPRKYDLWDGCSGNSEMPRSAIRWMHGSIRLTGGSLPTCCRSARSVVSKREIYEQLRIDIAIRP